MSFWIRWRLRLIVTWWYTLIPVVNMPNLVFPLALSFWAIVSLLKRNTGTTDAFHQLFEDWPAREVTLFLKLTTKHEKSWSVRCYLTNIIINPESKSASARSFEGTWGEDKWRMPWQSFASLTRYCNEDSFQNGWWFNGIYTIEIKNKTDVTYHIGWWFIALNPSTVGMDSKNGAIKLIKCLVEIETLPWFVKPDWNAGLETSQLFMMNMWGNPVLVVSHLVPYLKRWNIWKSTRIYFYWPTSSWFWRWCSSQIDCWNPWFTSSYFFGVVFWLIQSCNDLDGSMAGWGGSPKSHTLPRFRIMVSILSQGQLWEEI